MIGWLRGEVLVIDATELVVGTESGVGYRLIAPDGVLARAVVGQPIDLHISTQVRETAIELFGFSSLQERQVFERVIKINGVGARTARQILSLYGPADLVQIAAMSDKARLKQVPGIGPKTAERIVLELKDALGGDIDLGGLSVTDLAAPTAAGPAAEAIAALVQLGFAADDASARVNRAQEVEPDGGSDALIRLALQETAA